jgi:staphylococcal nuclease domain-containing protein 1
MATTIFKKSNGFQKTGGKPAKLNKGTQQGGNKPEKQAGQKKAGKAKPQENKIQMEVGIVRAVNSGDTVTILELNGNQQEPKEILFTILGLQAPTLGRRDADGKMGKDEPFAWQSREYLRKLVIGQPVVYRKEHSVADDRHYGELWDYNEQDIRLAIVMNGWASVISKPERKAQDGSVLDPFPSQLRLEKARDEAKSHKRGIWANQTKDAVRKVTYHDVYRDEQTSNLVNDDLYHFYKAHKDKGPLNAIVESVRNGTTLNLILPNTFDYITLSLSGVRSPALKPEVEPFSREAKYITEHLLLHRDVTVTLDGLDRLSLYGTVSLNGSNIALNLLNMGLAVFVEWTCKENTSMAEKFREAEKKAQESKLRVWSIRDFPSRALGGSKGKQGGADVAKETSITGKVIEVINAGTITVRVTKSGANNTSKTVDRVITFSSIRLPRAPIKANVDKDDKNDKLAVETLKRENAYAVEAKDFLRNLLIGQKVRCHFDYPRASRSPDDKTPGPVKHYWSVYVTKGNSERNVALELVQQGYAWVVDHASDELRSSDYKELILAEKAAKTSGKGLHGPPNKIPRNYLNDLTQLPDRDADQKQSEKHRKALVDKCKHFLTGFTTKDKVDSVVDYVFSGGRYKLTVPSQNCTIMFSLMGVIVERPTKSEEKIPLKPDISNFDKQYPLTDAKTGKVLFGNQVLHYVRDTIFQRKVDIAVKKVDDYATFIGQLWVDGKDFGLQLIEKGYAKIHRPSLLKQSFNNTYKAAEDKAKTNKIGLWKYYNFEEEKQRLDALAAARNSQPQRVQYPIAVTDVRTGNQFSFQILNEEVSSLDELATSLHQEKFGSHPPYTPKQYDIVAAQFTVDDIWYRAQILAEPKGGKEQLYEVRYIDFGNRESVGVDRIRKLPKEYIDLLSPQAKDAKLLYVKAPPLDSEFGRDSLSALRDLMWEKVLSAEQVYTEKAPGLKNTDWKDPQLIYHLIVTNNEEKINLNNTMIAQGHAKVQNLVADQDPFYTALEEIQEEARNKRLGIWQYGDYPDSDEEQEL